MTKTVGIGGFRVLYTSGTSPGTVQNAHYRRVHGRKRVFVPVIGVEHALALDGHVVLSTAVEESP
jgi:hypothetical protein